MHSVPRKIPEQKYPLHSLCMLPPPTPPPLLLLLHEALQLQSFGLFNEFLPFAPVSDAVLPVYFYPCYIAPSITLPSIFKSS